VQSGVVEALIRPSHLDRVPAVDPAREEAWLRRFERARDTLREAGIPVNEDNAAAETYCRARAEWEIPLRAAADALGEQWDDVTVGF